MKNKILLFTSDEILEEWKKDSYVMIDRDNSVKSESLRIHNEHYKYLKYLKDVKRGKYLLEEAYAKLFKNKTLYYEYDSVFTKEQLDGFGWKYDPFDGRTRPKTKEKLKIYFDSDEDLLSVQNDMKELDNMYEIIKHILKQYDQFTFFFSNLKTETI
jgi:hypothetical protein